MLFQTIFSFAISFFSVASPNCSCIPISVQEGIDKSDISFTAKILNVDTLKVLPEFLLEDAHSIGDTGFYTKGHLVKVKISHVFKGLSSSDTLHLMTGQGGGDCGVHFEINREYIIYADFKKYYVLDFVDKASGRVKSHYQNYLTTNDCTRTTDRVAEESRSINTALSKREIKSEL